MESPNEILLPLLQSTKCRKCRHLWIDVWVGFMSEHSMFDT